MYIIVYNNNTKDIYTEQYHIKNKKESLRKG